MAERFTDYLHRRAAPIWEAQHHHRFVRGIGDGTLDVEKFKHWVKQDYLYLIDYARLFAMAVAKAPDLETMMKFAELVHAVLNIEMDLHRSYAREWGISAEELEKTRKAPTCQAYTDFLLRTATLGGFAELIGALLPCMWGFCEIGLMLAKRDACRPTLCQVDSHVLSVGVRGADGVDPGPAGSVGDWVATGGVTAYRRSVLHQ